MPQTVLIPTAGTGSRLGGLTSFLNKSLVSVSNKPAICFLIDKFPLETEFVIPVGYKSNLVIDFLELAYPNRNFKFIEIELYEGEGSGLGLTITSCKEYLQKPFIFMSCDSLVLEDIPKAEYDWMGYGHAKNHKNFRTVYVDGDIVMDICEKNADISKNHYPYIGIAGINSYAAFWENMELGAEDSIQVGESFGLRSLLPKKIIAHEFTWNDTGSLEGLEESRLLYKEKDSPNILDKANEAIWFVEEKVIKFSDDKDFIQNRVLRAKEIEKFIPTIIDHRQNMYLYNKFEGEVLSKVITNPLFDKFLEFSSEFWEIRQLNDSETSLFKEKCHEFYKDKTLDRVGLFFSNFDHKDREGLINDVYAPKIEDLFQEVDWENLSDGIPGRFHGDFHFENILWSKEKNRFVLLDWRQEFGGSLATGDIYYDFAKLLHGMIVSHQMIDNENYVVSWEEDVHVDILRNQRLVECEERFYSWLSKNNYDVSKVKILTSLIYLNIAALHHYPYSHFLFYLGKLMLNNEIHERST